MNNYIMDMFANYKINFDLIGRFYSKLIDKIINYDCIKLIYFLLSYFLTFHQLNNTEDIIERD